MRLTLDGVAEIWTMGHRNSQGLAFYTGSRLKTFKDNLFLAALSGQHVHRVVFNKDMTVAREEELFADLKERFRQVKQGPDGALYFSTDSGKLYKLY